MWSRRGIIKILLKGVLILRWLVMVVWATLFQVVVCLWQSLVRVLGVGTHLISQGNVAVLRLVHRIVLLLRPKSCQVWLSFVSVKGLTPSNWRCELVLSVSRRTQDSYLRVYALVEYPWLVVNSLIEILLRYRVHVRFSEHHLALIVVSKRSRIKFLL